MNLILSNSINIFNFRSKEFLIGIYLIYFFLNSDFIVMNKKGLTI